MAGEGLAKARFSMLGMMAYCGITHLLHTWVVSAAADAMTLILLAVWFRRVEPASVRVDCSNIRQRVRNCSLNIPDAHPVATVEVSCSYKQVLNAHH